MTREASCHHKLSGKDLSRIRRKLRQELLFSREIKIKNIKVSHQQLIEKDLWLWKLDLRTCLSAQPLEYSCVCGRFTATKHCLTRSAFSSVILQSRNCHFHRWNIKCEQDLGLRISELLPDSTWKSFFETGSLASFSDGSALFTPRKYSLTARGFAIQLSSVPVSLPQLWKREEERKRRDKVAMQLHEGG